MLSPSINFASGLLADAFNEVLRLDAYSHKADNTTVGVLPKDPQWLAQVRSRLGMLGKAGAQWVEDKPEIWAPVLVQFIGYASNVSAVARQQASGQLDDGRKCAAILRQVLLPPLDAAVKATTASASGFHIHYQAFKDIQPLLEASIEQGWDELADEEQQMVAIAEQLTHLQDVAASLESSITAADVTTGKAVIQTTVTMLYNVATAAGVSFSFIGMAGSAFTVGKFYYDLIAKTAEIADTLRKIGELQLVASEEAQAAAGTKLVLRLLYDFELSFDRITDVMPQIAHMWTNERGKVQQAIDALEAGADPATYFDIQTLSVASANWNAIAEVAAAIPTSKSEAGPPVTLDPQRPDAAAG